MPIRFWFLFIISALAGAGASAPPGAAAQARAYHARLDSLFAVLEKHDRMMGSVTIRKGGRVIYQRTMGFRDSASAGWVRADQETKYRVGSVTKPFTAIMVYQLVDEGRLTLDTRLGRFFPGLPGADAVTVRDLLGHTSGLHDYTAGMDPGIRLDRAALLRRISAEPLQFPPGSRRRYSNSNYLLLGYLIEDLTGSTYAEQLRRRVVERTGLRRTHFGGAVDPDANEARSYAFDDGHWVLQPDHVIENAGGAGGIVSTTWDLTLLLSSLFEGRLVTPASRQEMLSGFVDGARRNGKGLSPFLISGTERSGFSHDGSIGAFTALVGYVPDDSLALALTINGHNYPQNRIFFHVWDILYGIARPLPSFTPVALADGAGRALTGVYTADAYGLTITIRQAGAGLEAQAQGQDAFPLTSIGQNRFMFVPGGILIEFADPVGGVSPRFTLYQQRAAIPLVRTGP